MTQRSSSATEQKLSTQPPNSFLLVVGHLILDRFGNSLVKVQRMLREPRYEYLQGRTWYKLAEALGRVATTTP